MKTVKVLQSFFVGKTSSNYMKGWKGDVSDELAERHGPDGTGFLEVIGEAKPAPNLKKDEK